MTLEYKDFSPVLKALDEQGKGQAIIATLNTLDRDGDITHAGAFGEQDVKVLMAHKWDQPSVGYARLRESGASVVADFELNLKMHAGREVYESLKFDHARGRLQEWSYGFQVIEHEKGTHEGKQVRFLKKVKAWEISPVVAGAGVGTGTLVLKHTEYMTPPVSTPIDSLPLLPSTPAVEGKRLVSPHQTATVDLLWNPYLHRARVKASGEPFYFAAGYLMGYGDDLTLAKSWLGLHHEVMEDGSFGAANMWAVEALEYYLHLGLFPDAWREPMWAHLSKHKQDAGVESMRLGAPDSYTYPLLKREQYMLRLAKGMMQERLDIQDIKAAKGMTVTESHRQAMQEHRDTLVRQCEILAIAPTLAMNDAAIQELNGREYAKSLFDKVDARVQAEQQQQADAERARGDELYQRYLARQQRLQHAD